jgi:hypothetical protein
MKSLLLSAAAFGTALAAGNATGGNATATVNPEAFATSITINVNRKSSLHFPQRG